MTNIYNSGVKPGHINMGKALRSMEHKTGGVRRLSLVLPEIYAKDSYGVETSTVQMPRINIPSMLSMVQPITTKDFQLAKEGRYIAGAARIFVPNMDTIMNSAISSGYANQSDQSFQYVAQRIPSGNVSASSFNQYFRGIDGLMDAVFYDEEAEIWNAQPRIEARGVANWSATTNYATQFGSDWGIFSSGATLSSDGESIMIRVSGQANNTGTILWNPGITPALTLADRVSFDIMYGDEQLTDSRNPSNVEFMVCFPNSGAAKYGYVKYSTLASNQFCMGIFMRNDFPYSSGSLGSFYSQQAPVNPWYTSGDVAVPDDWPDGVRYNAYQTTSDITFAATPNAGTLNTAGEYNWSENSRTAGLFIALRFRCSSGDYTQIKIKNIRFYRSIPWSIHSIKDRKDDFMTLNCVRTDGDSMHRQEAYQEQVPEL